MYDPADYDTSAYTTFVDGKTSAANAAFGYSFGWLLAFVLLMLFVLGAKRSR